MFHWPEPNCNSADAANPAKKRGAYKKQAAQVFETLRHNRKIKIIQAGQQRRDKLYQRAIDDAKKAKSSRDEISSIYSQWSDEDRWDNDEILQLNSNFLRAEAERLFVPFPEWSATSTEYEESEFTGKVRLKQQAQALLRKAIRQERKEAAEQWLMWTPFLSLLVAIMSVGVAALAIIIRR